MKWRYLSLKSFLIDLFSFITYKGNVIAIYTVYTVMFL